MDARRAIILIGIAVISYLLILQWSDDYGKRPVTQNVMTSQSSVSTTPDISPEQSVNQDIPDVSNDQPTLEQPNEVISTDLIEVQTDVLDIRINPQGGDIVYAALKAFPQSLQDKNIPFVLLEQSNMRTFVAQSGLVGQDGIDKNGRALFSAPSTQFEMADGENELVVTLSIVKNNVAIDKVFKFKRGDYLVDVGYEVNNQSANAWKANFYAQFKRDKSADPSSMESMGMASYLGAAVTRPSERYFKIDFDDMEEARFKETVQGGWAAFLQHYFLSAWVPNADSSHTYNTRKAGNNYIVGYYDEALNVASGEKLSTYASLYLGPKDQDLLAKISPNLELTVDYGWLWWVAQPLFWLLQMIHSIVGNWGWSIIFLTILVKLAFFPLSATSYRSMANMRRVAPKLTALREQYGEDRQKLSQEMMGLYKKEKINPLGGCLPILVQMPVFIALYWVLMESVELRQAPFMFWLQDLSIKDPYFILPLIMGASMFVQMQLNPTPPDPMQAKVMKLMPVIFTVFFLFFPAGLVLYWVVNNLLSIAQQYYITKQIENEAK
ncbi:MAG: YidC/Oxa1 family membrane protein insertase [Oceanicoccus sp.]|jgi:YidC/Oxa1 family membrane protein insertase